MQTPAVFSTPPELRKKLRRSYAKCKRLGGTTTWDKPKAQRSSDNRRSPSAKSPRLPVMDAPKNQYDCKRCGRKHGPKQCPTYGEECSKCKKKGHFAEQCRSKANVDPSSKRSSQQKQIPGLKKKFHEATADSGGSEADFSEYDTEEVTVQVDSIEAKTEETK